jgi:hypothetical protein
MHNCLCIAILIASCSGSFLKKLDKKKKRDIIDQSIFKLTLALQFKTRMTKQVTHAFN